MNGNLKAFAIGILGAVVGGTIVWVAQGHTLQIVPGEIKYSDLIATLLAVAALFLGVIGLVVASAAIWGFKYFKQVAVSSAKRAAHDKVSSELTSGAAKTIVVEEARRVAEDRIEEEIRSGSTRKYLDGKVNDAIAAALAGGALAGRELVAKRADEEEKFRDLDEQGGE